MANPHLKKFLFIFFFGFFLFQASFIFALEIKYPPVPGALTPQEIEKKLEAGEIPQNQVLPLYFKYFFNLSFIIIVLVCIGVLIYGGVLYLVSSGKPVLLVSAKKWITSASLGLLILFSSYLILVTINPQLAIFKFPSLEEIEFGRGPERIEIKETATYTEIPLGQLIEEKILTKEAEKKFEDLLNTARKAVEQSAELKQKLQELKNLTEACSCGISNCDPVSEIGVDRVRCDCHPKTNQCQEMCDRDDKEAIKKKMEEVNEAIAKLEKANLNLGAAQLPITNDYFDIKKALMAIDLGKDVVDYYGYLPIKYLVEKSLNIEVKAEPYSISWPKIESEIKTPLKEIENQIEIAMEATTTNATVSQDILEKVEAIKDQIGKNQTKGIMGILDQTKSKVNEALIATENTEQKIIEALNKIDYFLSEASSSLEEVESKTDAITTSSQELKLADFQISNIQKSCEEIKNLISESGPIREELSKIENLKTEVTATTTLVGKLEKLTKINESLANIENYFLSVWSPTVKLSDPATFYLPTSRIKQIQRNLERILPGE